MSEGGLERTNPRFFPILRLSTQVGEKSPVRVCHAAMLAGALRLPSSAASTAGPGAARHTVLSGQGARFTARPGVAGERPSPSGPRAAATPVSLAAGVLKRRNIGLSAATVPAQELVCAAPNVPFCARKLVMSAGTPACAPDLNRIAGWQLKRTRYRTRGRYPVSDPAEPAYAADAGGSAGRPAQRAAVATRRVMPQSGRTFSACGPFCPWVASNSTFWFSSRDL